MKKILGFMKKYKLLILFVGIFIVMVLLGIDIYHRLLGNIDKQEQLLEEKILDHALHYRAIIDKDLKATESEIAYIITDRQITKREVANHTEKVITEIDNSNKYGILLSKKNSYQYYFQSGDYCVSQSHKNGELKIRKSICPHLSNEETIGIAIQKYSTSGELIADTTEIGLDETKPYTSKLYFRGENPNNYIIYENSCYRIMSIAQNNSVKIIYEGPKNEQGTCEGVAQNNSGYIALLAWDNDKKADNDWSTPTSLSFNMNDWVEMGKMDMKSLVVTIDKTKLATADWYIGKVDNNETIQQDIEQERSKQTQGTIGLITPSEYNKIMCKTSAHESNEECKKDNYLYKDCYSWWTLNRSLDSADGNKASWSVNADGETVVWSVPYSNEFSYKGIRPVFYLKNDVLVKGIGTDFSPYILTS